MARRLITWERHLTDSAREGDTAAVRLFVECFRPLAFAVAMDRLGNVDDAADVAQETVLKALAHLDRFDAARPVRPWVARIAANLCTDIVRSRRRRGETVLDETTPDVPAEGAAELALVADGVRGAVDRLPEPYRQAVALRHFEELDVKEIAERLSVPEGTVKSWLHRARALLRADAALAGV